MFAWITPRMESDQQLWTETLENSMCFQKEQFVCEWKLMFEEKSEKLSGNDCFCKEDRV